MEPAKKRQRTYTIVILIVIFGLAIVFEAFQQLFYIQRFNLSSEPVTFLVLLKNQSYRWVIWGIFAVPLAVFSRKHAKNEQNITSIYLSYTLLILILVASTILVISTIQYISIGEPFNWSSFFKEYVTFYTFQKAPIFTLGYIAVAFIFYLDKVNEQLSIEIRALGELKVSDKKLYDQLSAKIQDSTTVLKIKIGNKHKIIPIDEIVCLEADDYCVKIHTVQERNYSMRSTLKALEDKLPLHFLRVHRKFIVNMKMVKELNTKPAPNLHLTQGDPIPVAKSRLKDLKTFYLASS